MIKHYAGGVEALAKEFDTVRDRPMVNEMKEKLLDKFGSENHAGPKDVSDFMDLIDDEEIALVKRDAYEQVQALIDMI